MELRRNPRNPYVKKDLGTTNRDEAVRKAWDEFNRLTHRIKATGTISTVTLPDRVKAYLDWAEPRTKLMGRDNRPIFKVQEFKKQSTSFTRYLIPYFEKVKARTLETITSEDIAEFREWRLAYYITGPGRDQDVIEYQRGGKTLKRPVRKSSQPASSTVAKDFVALKALFKFHKVKLPDIAPVRVRPGVRPGFDDDEFQQLFIAARIRSRIRKKNESETFRDFHLALDPIVAVKRRLLLCFVMFMAGTGLRPQEVMWLKFENIRDDVVDQDGNTSIRIIVQPNHPALKHHTHARTVVPTPLAVRGYRHLLNLYVHGFKPESMFGKRYLNPDLKITKQSWIWMHPTGERIASFDGGFDELLEDAGLLRQFGEKRSPYSLRHYYATDRILAGIPLSFIADNMGTSEAMLRSHYKHTIAEMHSRPLSQEREKRRTSVFDRIVGS
ncbi:hypothetical protein ABAZ39_09600 [Azospirillum argentinense]|uniref:Tyr recombinase domain-containing protein n=2 Tax=Azospirillum argentinense TaxID=2970906 RepID=A0A060DDK1_9PROT|nr:hypothetical protein ABAZ39_09600 [Azospirillum argentinense]EZQ09801.1 hypothetical protein ABAZ39_11025 [Azospirillum argentinense]